ncbi:MAG: hypothetical protein ACXV2H_09285 [Actinomycetes bacterium]
MTQRERCFVLATLTALLFAEALIHGQVIAVLVSLACLCQLSWLIWRTK